MFNTPNYNNYTYPWNTYAQSLSQQQQQAQPQSNGINWVQGEAGAKSYALAPNQSILLVDSERDVFYIKATDSSGMPLPLRIFDFTERTAVKPETPPAPIADYVTREEFEKRIAEITTNNGKQHIQSTKQQ